jgi:peroxiredoxin
MDLPPKLMLAAAGLALAACTPPAAPAAAPAPDAVTMKPEDNPRPQIYALLGQPAPAFALEKLGGGAFDEKSLNGQWTILYFWGAWCGDCLRDAPHTFALVRAIAQDPGLRFASIHVDARTGKYPSLEAYFAEKGEIYPVAIDPGRDAYRAFQIRWVPTYLVIDPQGIIRGFRTDLSVDSNPEGGVKAFLQQVADLKARAAAAAPTTVPN